MEKIYKSVVKFLQPLTPEETYATIVQEALKLVNLDDGEIFLTEGGELKNVYASSPAIASIKARKRGFAYTCFRERRAFVINTPEIKKIHPEVVASGIRSVIFIPLSYRHKSIGVLVARSFEEEFFSNQQLNILKLFGSMASLAIQKTKLYNETKKSLEVRDLFISMAAHEFRTPLTTINGYVQLLQSKLSEADGSLPISRWVKELSWETVRLTKMVNELLEVSRMNAGHLQYVWREHHLKEIIARALTDFHFNHPTHQVAFQSFIKDDQDVIVGDFDKLLQVLINLLDNAGKFSSPDRVITVKVRFKSPYFILNIKDQGWGITKRDLSRVFEEFYKGEGEVREGMGIGLYLAKKIVEEHRGSIHIHSKVNKGTLVEVQLPRVRI